jgi:uncharacterized membrane protein
MLFNHGGEFGPGGRGFVHHGWWWGFWGHFIPFLLFVGLIALVVWALFRFSGPRYAPAVASPGVAPMPRRDPALEEVRLRYARGEMSREEFVQRNQDLGGESQPGRTTGLTRPEGGEPTEPDAG